MNTVMTKTEIAEKLTELEKLTRAMEVPEFKRKNVYWLRKNLASRNEKHRNYEKVMGIVTELANKGISGA